MTPAPLFLTPAQLLRLAKIVAEAQRPPITLDTVSRWVSGGRNSTMFSRLERGYGCNTNSLARATAWMVENWSPHWVWPADIPRCEPEPRCAAE